MKIEKLTRKSHYYNEDRFIIGQDFAMVVDGATSLESSGIKPSEACWLVNLLKKNILKEKGTIIERLNLISQEGYRQFKKLGNNSLDYLPSATLAWVEFKNDNIVCYTIGDCEIVIKFKDGTIKRLVQKELKKLDDCALEKMKEESIKHSVPFLMARKYVDDLLIHNRRLINKSNGYSAFTIDENPNFKYEEHIFDRADIDEVYLYTDGITQAIDELKIHSSCEDMFKKSLNLKKEVAMIVERCNDDPLCEKYHRFKKQDDITIIKISMNA